MTLIFNEGMVGIESPVETAKIQHEVQSDIPLVGGTSSDCQSQSQWKKSFNWLYRTIIVIY